MSQLTGPLYSRVLAKIEKARPTGKTTSLALIQQRVCVLPKVCPPHIYHVGLVAESSGRKHIFEHGPIEYDPLRALEFEDTVYVQLPSVINTIDDILTFELTLPTKYIIGMRDCRHHVIDLLDYLYF